LSTELLTPHLRLIALSVDQLKQCLTNLSALGNELGIPISTNIIDEPVVGAINLKSDKMMASDWPLQVWFTYWLIVTKDSPFGAGLIGFKGYPNAEGEAEIGYGLDEAYWHSRTRNVRP
jgi:ribosomal-protein-alanine N-acetyltransferase